jgi:hypothetical protein
VGRPVRVALADGQREARLEAPDGTARALPAATGEAAFTPVRAGFYRLNAGGGERVIAVNLAADTRHDLTPKPPPRVGQESAARPVFAPPALQQPLWALLALVAALLLVAEWLTYHRRVTL